MATINLENIDDKVVEGLEKRARMNNRTLEGEIEAILERASGADYERKRKRFLAISDELRKTTKGTYQEPSEIFISRDRELGHPREWEEWS